MSIKSEMVNENTEENEEKLELPCLMKAINGDVIIATSEDGRNITGTLVKMGYKIFPIYDMGYHSDKWIKNNFEPLEDGEKITLQNNFE